MRKLLIILFLFCAVTSYSQVVLTIEGQTYTNSSSSWDGVNISRSVPTLLTFRNNSITSVNTSGYMLQAGDDDTRVTANNLDNAVISGNKLDWNGTAYTGFTHGIMAGYNLNYTIQYNYIDGSFYGIVHEGGHDDGTSMVNTGGQISYNIFKNNNISILTMGYENVNIYNNTFYISSDTDGTIQVAGSNGTDEVAYSKNVKVYNNIFYSTVNSRAINITSETSRTGFECDYNVYYWTGTSGNKPRFRVNGTTISWEDWLALGYDAHSVIVNPAFTDITNFVPAARLDYGTNLGTSYDTGLTTAATWVVGNAPATIDQDAIWQVGARILTENPSPTALYVSPLGNDANAGTFAAPWLTLNKAFDSAVAGDTVYYMGGVYYPTSESDLAYFTHDGTAENPICHFNYPGETPIFDCSNVTTDSYVYVIYGYFAHYFEIKGLTIRNLFQSHIGDVVQGIEITQATSIKIENCVIHDVNGVAFGIHGANYLLLKNCDAYNLCDSLQETVPGQNGTGFAVGTGVSWGDDMYDALNYIEGCRAWNASDQGFASGGVGYMEFKSCWSWNNGLLYGDGIGFKTGIGTSGNTTNPLSTYLYNCIAADNGMCGITPNNLSGNVFNAHYYNSFFYHNGYKPDLYHYDGTFGYGIRILNYIGTTPAPNEMYSNNISYANQRGAVYAGDAYTHEYNSWDLSVTVSSADFVSLDTAQLRYPRQADFTLPVITFGTLAATSDLINAGNDVGLAFDGSAPDLGYAEYTLAEEPSNPYISTTTPYAITANSAKSGGYMISDGGGTISAKGICWSTSSNPDLTDNVISGGTGTDDFTVTISGLVVKTIYHCRAYATNEVGTTYGEDEQFTTSQSSIIKHAGKIVKR